MFKITMNIDIMSIITRLAQEYAKQTYRSTEQDYDAMQEIVTTFNNVYGTDYNLHINGHTDMFSLYGGLSTMIEVTVEDYNTFTIRDKST